MSRLHLRAGTRGSRLALWQTDFVIDRLHERWPGLTVERVPISTLGDRVTTVPLPRIGDKGLFTRELEDALRAGVIDFAVHSLKDLPTEQPPGLLLGAILKREDPRDALVARAGTSLATLRPGARVGTSSLRRRAQILARRPDLDVRDLRGNVPTRVEVVLRGDLDAAVLALAGLTRIGLTAHVAEVLGPEHMLPAPGQGALAVQMRADDNDLASLLAAIDDREARLTTTAERAMLGRLEGGCQVPVGALAVLHAGERLALDGLVIDLDGHEQVRRSAWADAADEHAAVSLGERLADALRADGADRILARVRGLQEARGVPDVPES